jgi:HPt (histidine-containing phosphotransfer) domain-containing protein
MALKDFIFRKSIERKISGMSDEQKEAIVKLFQQHPEFIESITKEIEAETKSGRNYADAIKYVMEKNQRQLMQIFKDGGLIK